VIGELGQTLVPLIGEDIVLEQRLGTGPAACVEADRSQLEQVIMNLVVNARDAMPRGGRLLVATAHEDVAGTRAVTTGPLQPGRYVTLLVEDSGVGMDEETLSRIFDPFFTTKSDGAGTGLGLSTVYGIVEQAGGAVAVSSTPGQGTRFRLYFPAVADVTDRFAPDVRAGAGPEVRGSETVVVVEDQIDLGGAIRDALTEYGYRVLLASDPAEAIALAGRVTEPIQLLVSDVVMPRMSGSELAARMAEVRPGIKVLFISGYTHDAAFRKGILERTAAFLAKPFLPAQLARKVREVLDG
jgi:two-component system cell cycle sensor histidine kinase/response regulator CckA